VGLKQKDREIESLRKEITGENLVAEYQNIQEEIQGKEEELRELKKKKSNSHHRTSSFSFLSFNSNKSEPKENEIKIKEIEEKILKLKKKEVIIENDLKSANVVTKAPLTPN